MGIYKYFNPTKTKIMGKNRIILAEYGDDIFYSNGYLAIWVHYLKLYFPDMYAEVLIEMNDNPNKQKADLSKVIDGDKNTLKELELDNIVKFEHGYPTAFLFHSVDIFNYPVNAFYVALFEKLRIKKKLDILYMGGEEKKPIQIYHGENLVGLIAPIYSY